MLGIDNTWGIDLTGFLFIVLWQHVFPFVMVFGFIAVFNLIGGKGVLYFFLCFLISHCSSVIVEIVKIDLFPAFCGSDLEVDSNGLLHLLPNHEKRGFFVWIICGTESVNAYSIFLVPFYFPGECICKQL